MYACTWVQGEWAKEQGCHFSWGAVSESRQTLPDGRPYGRRGWGVGWGYQVIRLDGLGAFGAHPLNATLSRLSGEGFLAREHYGPDDAG